MQPDPRGWDGLHDELLGEYLEVHLRTYWPMTYDEFQHLARLYIIGSLDAEEMERFTWGRELFGAQGEAFIGECRKLNAVFALSLKPRDPAPDTKRRLMTMIRESTSESATRPPAPTGREPFTSKLVELRMGLN